MSVSIVSFLPGSAHGIHLTVTIIRQSKRSLTDDCPSVKVKRGRGEEHWRGRGSGIDFDENADEKVAQQNKIKICCADEVDFFSKRFIIMTFFHPNGFRMKLKVLS